MGKLDSGCSSSRMKEGHSGAENSVHGMFADESPAGLHMDGFTCQSWASTNPRSLFACSAIVVSFPASQTALYLLSQPRETFLLHLERRQVYCKLHRLRHIPVAVSQAIEDARDERIACPNRA